MFLSGITKNCAGLDLALARGTDDAELRAERDRGHRQARRVDDVAGTAAEDRVVLVLAVHGEAARAALLQAVELLVAVVPAARTLVQVAADRADVADLRRADFFRRLRQSGIHPRGLRVGREIRERDRRADAQSAVRASSRSSCRGS